MVVPVMLDKDLLLKKWTNDILNLTHMDQEQYNVNLRNDMGNSRELFLSTVPKLCPAGLMGTYKQCKFRYFFLPYLECIAKCVDSLSSVLIVYNMDL